MPSIYDLKPRFQQLLRPVLQGLIALNMTPNQVTGLALLLSVGGGVLLLLGATPGQASGYRPDYLIWIPWVMLVRMALNALDGMLARELKQSTAFGEILNEVGDVVSDVILYLPLVFYVSSYPASWLFVVGFVFLAILSEFSGVLAKAMVGERRYDGPMGKSDRAFVVGLYCLVLYLWPGFLKYSVCVFGTACILLALSCFNRLRAITRKAA